MYQFKELTRIILPQESLPSEATTFDGKVFENEIEGYRTLSVVGRDVTSNEILTQDIDSRDGVEYVTANVSSRQISVKFSLKADSAMELNHKFNKLKYLLSEKQAKFSFADEPDCEYIGTLQSINDFEEATLNGTGSFTILCCDPYKYKKEQMFSGVGTAIIKRELWYEVLPEKIVVVPTATISEIIIKNEQTGKKIQLQETFKSNIPITLYPKKQDIIRNNISEPRMLSWTSDFENFSINQGDIITVSPPATKLEIYIRERLL